MSAIDELRWLIIGSVSAHEAQYAVAQRPADRRPRPPMRMGLFRVMDFGCCAWGLTHKGQRCSPHARVMLQSILVRRCRGQCTNCVVGPWTRTLRQQLPRTLQVALHSGTCTLRGTYWGAQDLDAFLLPRLGTHLGTSGGGLPLLFHTLVLPWWRRVPATRHRHSVNVS